MNIVNQHRKFELHCKFVPYRKFAGIVFLLDQHHG